MMMNKQPNTRVIVIRFLYLLIFLCRNSDTAICMVMLLKIIMAVEYLNKTGISNVIHLGWLLFTMYALVKPANIIMMLPIAIQSVNL